MRPSCALWEVQGLISPKLNYEKITLLHKQVEKPVLKAESIAIQRDRYILAYERHVNNNEPKAPYLTEFDA